MEGWAYRGVGVGRRFGGGLWVRAVDGWEVEGREVEGFEVLEVVEFLAGCLGSDLFLEWMNTGFGFSGFSSAEGA